MSYPSPWIAMVEEEPSVLLNRFYWMLSSVERLRWITQPRSRHSLARLAVSRFLEFRNDEPLHEWVENECGRCVECNRRWTVPHLFNGRSSSRLLCQGCDTTFVVQKHAQKYCTPECQNRASSARERDAKSGIMDGDTEPPPNRHVYNPVTSTLAETFVSCDYCEKPVQQSGKGRPKRFCSERCKQRFKRYR